MKWSDIAPELLAFVRDPVPKDQDAGGILLPPEMVTWRQKWNEFVAQMSPSSPAEPPPAPKTEADVSYLMELSEAQLYEILGRTRQAMTGKAEGEVNPAQPKPGS